MKSGHAVLCVTALATTLIGCAMAPLRPELPLLGNDLAVRSPSSEHAKLVVINNSSKLLHGADGTGRINVRLDGQAVGGPNIGEYLQVQVPKGKHTLEVWHLDVIKFRSNQEINVDQDLVIELKATPFSNKILVQSTMPAGDFRPLVAATDDEQEKQNVFRRSTAALSSYVRALR